MKKHIILALTSFILLAVIAGFTGSIILAEFAMSTTAGGYARIGILTGMFFIISLLGATTIPIIFMIQGLAAKLDDRPFKNQDGSEM